MKKLFYKVSMALVCVMVLSLGIGIKSQAANKARIQIVDYALEQKVIYSDEEATLILSVQNRSNTVGIQNIQITCSSENNLLYPVYGHANQLYISSLDPGEIKEVAIDLKARKGLQVESISYFLNIIYSDDYSEDNTSSVRIELPVSKVSTLLVHNYSVPEVAYQKAKTRISASFSNGGQSELSEIVFHIKGVDGTTTDNILPMNSLAGGESNFAEGYVTFDELGEQKITAYFTYLDQEGNLFSTDEKTFTIDVVDYASTITTPAPEKQEENVEEPPVLITEDMNTYIQWGILAAIIIILIGIIIVWRKDRR